MRASSLALGITWCLACTLSGLQVVNGSTPDDLSYRARFTTADPEYEEVIRFLTEVNACCPSGDVEGLLARLTEDHAAALQARVRSTFGVRLGSALLQNMRRVVPLGDDRQRFLIGRARGSRVVIVFGDRSLSLDPDSRGLFHLSVLRLEYDGFRLRLAAPRLTRAWAWSRRALDPELLEALAEDWLSSA